MLRRIGVWLLMGVGMVWLAASPVRAAVHYLPNPGNNSDIQPSLQSLINSSTVANYDTIELPAGEFLVNKQIEIRKFISLKGQGSGNGGTRLYRPDISDAQMETWPYRNLLYISCPSEAPSKMVISDIHFQSNTPSVDPYDNKSHAGDHGIYMDKCFNFLIINNTFEHFGNAAIELFHDDNKANGVIAKNNFLYNIKRKLGSFATNTTNGYGIVVAGDNRTWVSEPLFGSDNFIFVEDNYFIGHRHAIASGGGGLYVFRHNQVIDNTWAQAVDAHGVWGGNVISTRAYEVYNNSFVNNIYDDQTPIGSSVNCSKLAYTAIKPRGGESLIYNNTARGFKNGIAIIIERYHYEKTATYTYPEIDQIGYLSGKSQGANHTGINFPQSDGDLFEWNNTFTNPGGCAATHLRNDGPSYMLIKDRDYHLDTAKPGYQAYTYPHPLRTLYEGTITPTPIPPTVMDMLEWEAEDMSLSSRMQTRGDVNASGGKYIFSDQADLGLASLMVEVSQEGDYIVEGRVLPIDTGHNSFYVSFLADNTDPTKIWDMQEFSSNWIWDEVSHRGSGTFDSPERDPVVFHLSAGNHTLYFHGREANTQLDLIRISKLIPTPTPVIINFKQWLVDWLTSAGDENGDGVVNSWDWTTIVSNQ